MSSAATQSHPLIADLRREMEARYLTHVEVAQALGVSARTIAYWLATDAKMPQKRHRKRIAAWLEQEAQA